MVESIWLTGLLISILTDKVAVKGFIGMFGLRPETRTNTYL